VTKSRWYLATFPALALTCCLETESRGVEYGVPASGLVGGAPNASGGYATSGGTEPDGGDDDEIDSGSPSGGLSSAGMSVRYGPMSTLGTGGVRAR
jgi:hypothetical protein